MRAADGPAKGTGVGVQAGRGVKARGASGAGDPDCVAFGRRMRGLNPRGVGRVRTHPRLRLQLRLGLLQPTMASAPCPAGAAAAAPQCRRARASEVRAAGRPGLGRTGAADGRCAAVRARSLEPAARSLALAALSPAPSL